MANSQSGESVVHRVARILMCFDADHPELSASELAVRAGLASSTAHRLAAEMAGEGLLWRTGRGRFRVGLRLWEASQRGSSFKDFAQAALPFMEAVHVTLRQNVSLSILDRRAREVVYLERLAYQGAQGDLTKVAIRQPVLACAPGLAMLAHSSPALQDEVLASAWDPATVRSGATEGHLRRLMAGARTDGYVHLRGVQVAGLTGLAAPVLGPRGAVVGAMAVVQTLAEVNLAVQVPVLLSAVRGLSRSLA
jgi:DNA-binding IclR family transcriptional regulator